MDQYKSEHFPDNPENLPPARRRRAQRLLTPLDADQRAAYLAGVVHRASPSFDFFLFSLLSAAVIGAGLLLDSFELLLLGALLAPQMAPFVGLALSTITGSGRFFLRSLAGMAIGAALVFIVGVLAGTASRADLPYLSPWLSKGLYIAHQHAQLSWLNFAVLALSVILTCAGMVRPERSARLPSVALAYELYLPLAAAGIGLGSGAPFLFPDGLVVFAVHLAWGVLLGAFTLALLGFRPLTLFGYTLGGMVTLIGVVMLVGLSGAGAAISGNIALPTPSPTITPSQTFTVTPSLTPVPPTATPTFTITPTLTPLPPTDTPTLTITPTPVLALVASAVGGGVHLRAEPGYQSASLGVLSNGTVVQLLPEPPVEAGGPTWLHVQTADGRQGWIVQYLLTIATPAPNW